MSEDQVIRHDRQRPVNIAFVVITATFIVSGAYVEYTSPGSLETILLVYSATPLFLLFVSGIMGAGSKRAIDYIPGEWEQRRVWATFEQYDIMLKEHERAYGHLYAHPAGTMACCCMMPVALGVGGLALLYKLNPHPVFSSFIDSLILIIILYGIVSVLGFFVGYRVPKIDAVAFFQPPLSDDVYRFTRELADVPGIKAGVNVELGERAGIRTIIGAECKAYVEGLPDTVAIKVQVSHSGFAYPYLVGTVYKGKTVEAEKEQVRLRTRYPALIEYSMDKDVAVMVARFDIPKRTSEVPSISRQDFKALAGILVARLKQVYEPS
ncbi:MAG: hypothetical protein C4K49_03385 [Candidatus Thorarchaeota archaeon]|nr:MAG: hypothetical protein C4K49_03385 [Candidatus Thorarchaeota archaeon]